MVSSNIMKNIYFNNSPIIFTDNICVYTGGSETNFPTGIPASDYNMSSIGIGENELFGTGSYDSLTFGGADNLSSFTSGKCYIDDFQVYDRILTASEINTIYTSV